MHIGIISGLFWVIIASTVGETIVRTTQALRSRGASDDKARPSKDGAATQRRLTAKVEEMEQLVARQAQALADQEEALTHMKEQLDFTERLLSARNPQSPNTPPR